MKNSDTDSGRNFYKRTSGHKINFKRASLLLNEVVQKACEKRGFSPVELLTQWNEILGDRLANIIRPLRLNFNGNGLGAIMIIEVNGAFIPEIDLQKDIIIEKVNRFYGYRVVSKIAIRKSSNINFDDTTRKKDNSGSHYGAVSEQLVDPRTPAIRSVIKKVEDIENDEFRDSLKELCKLYLSRQK